MHECGRAESKGITLEVEQRFDKLLRLFANYTYTDARIKENSSNPASEDKRLTLMPDTMFNAGAEFEIGPVSGFSHRQICGQALLDRYQYGYGE